MLRIRAAPNPLPAYHSVQVKQTFSNPTPQYYVPPLPVPASAMSQEASKKPKINWPQPVREYVQRSFDQSNMLPDVGRPEMEAKLKETISASTDAQTLETMDWASLPLPQQMIREERLRASWQQQSVDFHMAANGLSTPSKKRKSQELVGPDEFSTPWRANKRGLENRVTFDKTNLNDNKKANSKLNKALEKRQKRFDGGYKSSWRASPSPEPISGPVVGTCQNLEKGYLRLTAAPRPSEVRPEHILKQSLEFLKKKWKKDGNYTYICDQFKSMRQDLTVQRISNELTVSVYEIHARIALEKGDLGEYNQCQSQLRVLYANKRGGNPEEFKAYRILYFIHTANRTALNDVLAELTPVEKKSRAIKHALDVRSALALGNYNRFFRLYLDTPNMGAYLMDMFVVRERLAAMAFICKACVSSIY